MVMIVLQVLSLSLRKTIIYQRGPGFTFQNLTTAAEWKAGGAGLPGSAMYERIAITALLILRMRCWLGPGEAWARFPLLQSGVLPIGPDAGLMSVLTVLMTGG